MKSLAGPIVVRLLPVALAIAAAVAYVLTVEGDDAYAIRNTFPLLAVLGLAVLSLRIGRGRWTGSGWCWPLGTLGFAIPALGLSLYLHYGYAVDLNGMYSESVYPREVFRYLPIYTSIAGVIGFLIGWIAGRNA
ncbi:MAG: hypothetical protein O3A13_05990 [Proteobacteria bacterium]|nr:hypothetical protein [Pseudomonadota bacterium]MDA0993165.1 hypothetical protein [Pseudomonadota bacterium]